MGGLGGRSSVHAVTAASYPPARPEAVLSVEEAMALMHAVFRQHS